MKDITEENLLNEDTMARVQVDYPERYLMTQGDVVVVSRGQNLTATEIAKPLEGLNTHRTVGDFSRKALSPQGEPCVHIVEDRSLPYFIACTTGRGKPRSPPRQGGPTNAFFSCLSRLSWLDCCR